MGDYEQDAKRVPAAVAVAVVMQAAFHDYYYNYSSDWYWCRLCLWMLPRPWQLGVPAGGWPTVTRATMEGRALMMTLTKMLQLQQHLPLKMTTKK